MFIANTARLAVFECLCYNEGDRPAYPEGNARAVAVNIGYTGMNGKARKFAEKNGALRCGEKDDLHTCIERYVTDELPDRDKRLVPE